MSSHRILIIQTAFLGDLILSTPFFHAVRKQNPNSTIHLIVNKGTESVLNGNPDIDRIFSLDKKKAKKNILYFLKFALILKKERYDIVYSPHFSFRSTLLSWITQAKSRIGYIESGFSFLHTKTVHRPRLGPHEVDKLFSLLFDDPIQYPKDRDRRPFLYPSFQSQESTNQHLRPISSLNQGFITLCPSSVWETKKYQEEGFSSLVQLILEKTRYGVVLTGSPADQLLNQRILELVWDRNFLEKDYKTMKTRVLDLAGKTSLEEMAVVISKSKAVITNDSSPVHYASAFNIPTVLIYGATVPDFGYYGLSERMKISEVKGLDCRPCGIHGGRICPQKHFRCMKDQDPKEIFNKLMSILE